MEKKWLPQNKVYVSEGLWKFMYVKYGSTAKNIGKGDEEAPDGAGGSMGQHWLEKNSEVIHSWIQMLSKSCTQCTLAVSVWLFMETGPCILSSSSQQINRVASRGPLVPVFGLLLHCWAFLCMSSATRKCKVQTSTGCSGTVCLYPSRICIPRGLAVGCVSPPHLPFVGAAPQLPQGQYALHICSLSEKSMTWASYKPVPMLWAWVPSILTSPHGTLLFFQPVVSDLKMPQSRFLV